MLRIRLHEVLELRNARRIVLARYVRTTYTLRPAIFGGGKPSSFIGNRYRHEPVNDAELCTARLPIKAVNTGLGMNAQDETVPLTLKDRRTHVYVVGKTGQGKSVLLENMMIDDLAAGRGFAFLDPHGTSAERIADCIPNDRLDDVIYFDPAALRCPSFNPLDTDDPDLTAEQIVTTIHDIFPSSWGPNLEYILYNDLRLLLENPGTTLLDLKKVLVNKPYRLALLAKTKDDDLRSIWEDEFAAKNEKQWNEEIRSTLNKIGRITSVRSLRRVLGGPPTLDFKDIMDEGKILICNLSVGKLGRGASRLLGALIVSGFVRAAESRTGKPRDFGLYADEFQNFFTESFDSALSEARKWRLGLVLAHQFVGQLPESLRQAILGNVGTLIAFQAGAESARFLADELGTSVKQLTDLSKYCAYVKLPEHSARHVTTFPPKEMDRGSGASVKANSAARHTKTKKQKRPQPRPIKKRWPLVETS